MKLGSHGEKSGESVKEEHKIFLGITLSAIATLI